MVTGWPKLSREQCADLQVPGGALPVHPALAPIFHDLAVRFHETVEPLEWPGCWGWAGRNVAGTDIPSKHWLGAAVDLNAPRHPRGVPTGRTFTRAQIGAVSRLLARYGGLIEWGGTWDLPDTDAMHFQLRDGVTFAEVAAWRAPAPAVKPAPARPAPAPSPASTVGEWTGPDLTGTAAGLRGQAAGQPQGPQSNGPRMRALQDFLNRNYPAYSHLAPDGWYGPATARVLAEFARRSGIPAADGLNIGPRLAAALHRAGFGRTLSAARSRVVGHVGRGARR